MTASMKRFGNVSITIGSFPIIVVTCLLLTVVDVLRDLLLLSNYNELKNTW